MFGIHFDMSTCRHNQHHHFLKSDFAIHMCIRISCFVMFLRMTQDTELETPLFPFCFLRRQRIGSLIVQLLQMSAALHPGAFPIVVTESSTMTLVLRHSKKMYLLTDKIKMLIPYIDRLTCITAMTPFFGQLRLRMPLEKYFLPTFN